jgi:predicted anti-sigma-YlaC factor YlaD
MKCDEIRERIPDVAAGFSQPSVEESNHLASCTMCADQLKAMRSTMALLDAWQVPEPSPYFDVRLQARLREEMAKPQASWLHWFRHPVLAAALTVIMGVGVGLFFTHSSTGYKHNTDAAMTQVPAPPGSAVSDLQALDKNHDMYSDFELLDDLDVQQNVVSNP